MSANPDISRDAFVKELLENNFTTYFVATHAKYSKSNPAFRFTPEPVSIAVPYGWSYKEARQRLFTLSSLLTPEEAERRNINFVNPGVKDFMPAATLPTLRGGIQLLLPGEQAYAHRHSANAFRLVLEAPESGAYTTVEGSRLPMCFGDLLCTPNWTWHDHHNESKHDVIWYDGLDVLMAYWIGGVFYQEMETVTGEAYQSVVREETAISNNFGPGLIHRQTMFPDHIPASNNVLTYYPYAKARQLLADLSQQNVGTPQDGIVLEYVNPVTSGPTFPTMATSVRLIEAKTKLETVQRTENVIFITLEGAVTFHLPNGQSISTGAFDVTAIPSWVPYSIENAGGKQAVLATQSDKPVFEALGFFRENTNNT